MKDYMKADYSEAKEELNKKENELQNKAIKTAANVLSDPKKRKILIIVILYLVVSGLVGNVYLIINLF